MKVGVGTIIKFQERYSHNIYLATITVDIPIATVSLYHYYAETTEKETFGLYGHEILTYYNTTLNLEDFIETYPEKII